jgi:redox-sensitive bicupin YhaK (pirin superfamily)
VIEIRKATDRGRTRTAWLDSRHTFSIGNFFDPRHSGFRALRVINEDWIAPATGFVEHEHYDMEILTFPLQGVLEHRDSTGAQRVLRPGAVQLMSAGTGIAHSEMNPVRDQTTHLLQIWTLPDRLGLAPGYQERRFELERGPVRTIATSDGRAGTLRIHQDASIHLVRLRSGETRMLPLEPERHAWVQVTRGVGWVGAHPVEAGDGAALSQEPGIPIHTDHRVEMLVFDLA